MREGRIKLPRSHPLAKLSRGSSIIPDHPETVLTVAQTQPEFAKILGDKVAFYERWVKALERSEALKEDSNPNLPMEFKVKPFEHQKRAIRFILSLPACALFAEPGTGKTFCALKSAEWRLRNGRCSKVLVIAPASTLRASWYEDCRKFTDIRGRIISNNVMWWWEHPRTGQLYRTMKSALASCKPKWADTPPDPELEWNENRDISLQLKTDYEMMICSPEIATRYKRELLAVGFDFVIMDESTMIKNASSKAFAAVYELGMNAKFRLALTGTPITNSIEDIWSQMQFVDNSFEQTVGEFREKYMERHPYVKFAWVNKKGCEEAVVPLIKNRCMWIKKQDCLDLPDRMTIAVPVEMSRAAAAITKRMMVDQGFVFDDGRSIVCDNPLTLAIKLRQIANGYVRLSEEESGDIIEIDKIPPKLIEIDRIASQHKKLLIWAIGRKEIDQIVAKLGGREKVAVIDGRTTSVDKELADFKDHKRYMVAHPKSARFGLTMTWCDTAVFYSYDHNLESYLQARDRIYRIGQKNKVTEYILVSGRVEELIWKSLDKKLDFSKLAMEQLIEKSE
jgi:SNF2 family DNA or RNA helicase